MRPLFLVPVKKSSVVGAVSVCLAQKTILSAKVWDHEWDNRYYRTFQTKDCRSDLFLGIRRQVPGFSDKEFHSAVLTAAGFRFIESSAASGGEDVQDPRGCIQKSSARCAALASLRFRWL